MPKLKLHSVKVDQLTFEKARIAVRVDVENRFFFAPLPVAGVQCDLKVDGKTTGTMQTTPVVVKAGKTEPVNGLVSVVFAPLLGAAAQSLKGKQARLEADVSVNLELGGSLKPVAVGVWNGSLPIPKVPELALSGIPSFSTSNGQLRVDVPLVFKNTNEFAVTAKGISGTLQVKAATGSNWHSIGRLSVGSRGVCPPGGSTAATATMTVPLGSLDAGLVASLLAGITNLQRFAIHGTVDLEIAGLPLSFPY